MTISWGNQEEMSAEPITKLGWCRIVFRCTLAVIVTVALVILSLLIRLVERPFYGQARPFTPYITQIFFRALLRIFGIRWRVQGTPMTKPGAVVSNHSSWLDIFVLNAATRIYFVSKAEVASWPGIGFLASMVGTVFIKRDRREARGQTDMFRKRLLLGHKLLFFPEGTSTDNFRVLPFKTTLFQAFMEPLLKEKLWIQPVTLVYHAPDGVNPKIYGWWGDMEFGEHFLQTLALRKQGVAEVTFHPPVKVSNFDDRKAIASELEATVRKGMPEERREIE